jgi:hypothetical protein
LGFNQRQWDYHGHDGGFFLWEYHWIKGWQQFRMLNNGFPDLDQGDKKGNALIDFSFTNP